MKKICFFCAFFLITVSCSLDAQSWQIFTPEYSFYSGKVNLEKVIKTKIITDVVKTADGTLWLSCGDSYPVYIKTGDKDFEIGSSGEAKMKELNYVPSAFSKFVALPGGEIWLFTRQNILKLSSSGNWEGFNTKTSDNQVQGIPVPGFDLIGDPGRDKDGNLWISGIISKDQKCGLAKLEKNAWTYYMLPDEIVSVLLSGNKPSKGVKLLAGKEMRYEENPLLKLIIKNLCFDIKGNAWMSLGELGGEGLCKFSNGQFELFNTEKAKLPTNLINDIETDIDGTVYLSTDKGLLVTGADGKFIPSEKVLNPVQMKFDSHNMLWMSMAENEGKSWRSLADQQSGIVTVLNKYNVTDKSTFEFTTVNTPLLQDVTGIYFDDKDVRYFIVNGDKPGLFILQDNSFKNSSWRVISEFGNGKEEYKHYSLSTGYNDNEWNFTGVSEYGKERSLNVFKNGVWTYADFKLSNEPTGLLSGSLGVYAIAKDGNDNIYLGTSNYVYKYGKLANIVEGYDKSKIAKQVNCLSTDKGGRVWIGTTKGLASYDGSKFMYYDKSNSEIPGNMILNLLTDSKDRTWVGTPNGLLCIDKEKQIVYNNKNGLNNERIVALAENSSGTVFVAASNINTVCRSIYFEDNGSMKEEKLPELSRIMKMVFDKNDNLWIGCEGSLLCRTKTGQYKVFNKDNSPIQPLYVMDKIFVVGNEIWIPVQLSTDSYPSSTGTQTVSASGGNKETQILNSLKPKISGLDPDSFTLIFNTENL